MNTDLISVINAQTRDDAIKQLVHIAHLAGKLEDETQFFNAIIERERIVSTGIGMGIAIPHAKLPSYDQFFIAIGLLRNGVDWDSLDNAPVKTVFMIGGPDDKQTEYLQLLSSLTSAIKPDERRKKLLTLTDPEEIIALFQTSGQD